MTHGAAVGGLPDVGDAVALCCCPTEYLKKSAPTDQKYGNEAGTPYGKKKISQKTTQEKLPLLRKMIAFWCCCIMVLLSCGRSRFNILILTYYK